jgi:hypothetical protein
VAQDGMKVRAHAGQSSFRRGETLDRCLTEAQEQVEALRQLAEQNPDQVDPRRKAARERAARERQERVAAAREHCRQLQQQREKRAKQVGEPAKQARASTTDPESRSMKFPNGGYAPGYNVQAATDVASGIVVGVEVTSCVNDTEQMPPMVAQIQERYDRAPAEMLVDGGFAAREAITAVAKQHECVVYAPLKAAKKSGNDPHEAKRGDSPEVIEWRKRMATDEAKAIYKQRASSAEWVNAQCRNRGLQQMPVRGLKKCRIIALLHALTHNLVQARRLRALAAGKGASEG